MKFGANLAASAFLCILFFSAGGPLSGCSKNSVMHDTTVQTIHDTVSKTIHDTLTLKDTLYALTDGMVAYYNFDGGNLNDSSGNNNNISFNNASRADDRFGNPHNAYAFDGVQTFMQVPNSPSLNPANGITLFAIVKVNGFYKGSCHGNDIVTKGQDDATGSYGLGFNDPTIAGNNACNTTVDTTKEFFNGGYGDDNPVGDLASAGNDSFPYIHIGEWYTVAFTYDGSTARMYVNGALLKTVTKPVSFNPNSYDVFIGKENLDAFPYYFRGIIDELRIYNKAVPDQRIHILNTLKSRTIRPSSL